MRFGRDESYAQCVARYEAAQGAIPADKQLRVCHCGSYGLVDLVESRLCDNSGPRQEPICHHVLVRRFDRERAQWVIVHVTAEEHGRWERETALVPASEAALYLPEEAGRAACIFGGWPYWGPVVRWLETLHRYERELAELRDAVDFHPRPWHLHEDGDIVMADAWQGVDAEPTRVERRAQLNRAVLLELENPF